MPLHCLEIFQFSSFFLWVICKLHSYVTVASFVFYTFLIGMSPENWHSLFVGQNNDLAATTVCTKLSVVFRFITGICKLLRRGSLQFEERKHLLAMHLFCFPFRWWSLVIDNHVNHKADLEFELIK